MRKHAFTKKKMKKREKNEKICKINSLIVDTM